MQDLEKDKGYFDLWLLIFVISLTTIGLILIFSASSATAQAGKSFNFDPYYFLKRQLLWILIGMAGLGAAYKIDLMKARKFSIFGIAVSFVLLVLVLIPKIGICVMGARRWIALGPFSFQPAEVAKFAMVLYLADMAARQRENLKNLASLFPSLFILGVFCFLIERQPDLGTTLVIAGVYMVMIFLAGARKRYILSMVFLGMFFVIYRIFSEGYRMRRITAFFNPWKDPQDTGYHIIQSLIALGSGGIFGLGLGCSRQKFFYLPEQHTDFIFAIAGEELGLVGTLTLVFLFIGIIYRGFKIAVDARHPFLRMLAGGITFMLAFQAFINIGVVTAILPTTGIPLPFISFGGTSLVFNLISVGLLMNICRNFIPIRRYNLSISDNEETGEALK